LLRSASIPEFLSSGVVKASTGFFRNNSHDDRPRVEIKLFRVADM